MHLKNVIFFVWNLNLSESPVFLSGNFVYSTKYKYFLILEYMLDTFHFSFISTAHPFPTCIPLRVWETGVYEH